MEQQLKELIERLKSAFGQRLVSVILYGSAASPEEKDRPSQYSDLNVLIVLDHVDAQALTLYSPIARWWHTEHPQSPAPLLMDEEDVAVSTDCFPIEFEDMKERRRVLHGKDLVAGLEIDFSFYRARVEYELRSKLLRLRHQATPLLTAANRDGLLHLCADSVSTFLILARHGLRIAGHPIDSAAKSRKRATVAALEKVAGAHCDAFSTLLDLRDGKQPPNAAAGAVGLFDQYLNEIHEVIGFVDGLAK